MYEFLETIKAKNGEIYNIEYHQKRYGGNKNLIDYINPPKDGLYRCRLTYDDSNINITYHKYKKRTIKSLRLVYCDEILYDKKYTNRYELNELFEQRDDCDDILIVKNNLITDTSIANIAFFKSGVWYTPKIPLLKGITRERFIDESFLKEVDIEVRDLKSFERVALLNAMIDFDIIPSIKIKGDNFVRDFN